MKTIDDHIKDLQELNEFVDDNAIREAIQFIRWQNEKIIELTSHSVINCNLYTEAMAKIKLMELKNLKL